MQENKTLIELEGVVIKVKEILAVVKVDQPPTLQTELVPHIQFILTTGAPIFIPYESDEAREIEYIKTVDAMKKV